MPLSILSKIPQNCNIHKIYSKGRILFTIPHLLKASMCLLRYKQKITIYNVLK